MNKSKSYNTQFLIDLYYSQPLKTNMKTAINLGYDPLVNTKLLISCEAPQNRDWDAITVTQVSKFVFFRGKLEDYR